MIFGSNFEKSNLRNRIRSSEIWISRRRLGRDRIVNRKSAENGLGEYNFGKWNSRELIWAVDLGELIWEI